MRIFCVLILSFFITTPHLVVGINPAKPMKPTDPYPIFLVLMNPFCPFQDISATAIDKFPFSSIGPK